MKVKVVARRACVLGVAALLTCTGMAGAQVLQQLPADSLFVIRVANLAKVSAKAADFSKKLGIDQMSPESADPLAALEAKLGIKEGLDTNGEAAVAFLDHAKVGGGPEQAILILVPVTDYNAFLKNFADAKTEGEITETTTPEGEPAFVKAWGKYAAISPGKEALAAKPAGVNVQGALAKKELTDKDVVVFANFTALRPKLLADIQKNRAFWLSELEKDVTGVKAKVNPDEVDPNDPTAVDEATAKRQALAKKFLPAIKAAANKGIDILEAFAKDASSATYSLNLTDAGINGTLAAEFEPGSYGGKLLSSFKGSSDSLLAGLPAGKYLFFGGGAWDPKVIAPAFADLVAPVVKELNAINDDDSKAVASGIDAVQKMLGATTGQTAGLLAPQGQLMQEAILQTVTITRGDINVIGPAQKQLLTAQEQIMSLAQGENAAASKTTFTPAVRQVDGVTFDQYKTDITADPNSMEAAQAQQMLAVLYGPEGISGLIGKLDDTQQLTVSGLPSDKLSAAIKAAKAKEDTISAADNVKATVTQLPKNRLAAWYIPLDTILKTGLTYAQQAGLPMQIQLGENLPPIGVTVATEGSAIRMDGHLPTPLAQNIASAFMQVYANFQPRGGGGGRPPANNGGL